MRIHSSQGVRTVGRSTRSAFTLLEVLVVVAIIVMLAGVGGYYVLQRYEEAKISKAKIDCKSLAQEVGIYHTNNDTYPSSLQALAQNQPNGGTPLLSADKLKDPWGKQYQLDTSGLQPRVFTTSPKGANIDNLAQK